MISTYQLKVSSQKLSNEYKEWINTNYLEFFNLFKNPFLFVLIRLFENTFLAKKAD